MADHTRTKNKDTFSYEYQAATDRWILHRGRCAPGRSTYDAICDFCVQYLEPNLQCHDDATWFAIIASDWSASAWHRAPRQVSDSERADKNEDLNILRWLNQDSHIRARLKMEIFPPGKKRVSEGHFTFSRNDFDTSKTRDFATSFGAIDRVDFSVDFSDDTVRVWFKDRYEFHPVYPGLYLPKQPDDFVRGDNCVHAAAVEMKSQGAQDYWMQGEAVVPLSLITV